jgi:hypothetical protein
MKEQKKTEALQLRMTPDEKARLAKAAEHNPLGAMSMNAYIRLLINSVDPGQIAFVVTSSGASTEATGKEVRA